MFDGLYLIAWTRYGADNQEHTQSRQSTGASILVANLISPGWNNIQFLPRTATFVLFVCDLVHQWPNEHAQTLCVKCGR